MQIPSNSFKNKNQSINMDIAKDVTVKSPEGQSGTSVDNNKCKEAKISDLQSQLWSKVTVNLERIQLTTLMDMLKLHQDGDKSNPGTSTSFKDLVEKFTSSGHKKEKKETAVKLCPKCMWQDEDEPMIRCANDQNCPDPWYHRGCVGLRRKPRFRWYCHVCQKHNWSNWQWHQK